MRQFLLSAAIFALLLGPVQAQQSMTLEIKDGRVNLDTTSVTSRQILAEWARVGGTKIVGAEKITGGPLTLKLVNLPERQALDIILRTVAGYMAAPRPASAAPGASMYDRILIMPTSTVASSAASNNGVRLPNAPGATAGLDRRVPPRPPGLRPADSDPDDSLDQSAQDDEPNNVNPPQPVFTFPQPGNQVFVPVPPTSPGGVPTFAPTQPQITLQPNANGQPTIYNFLPTGTAAPGGFTVIGSPTPGVIQQPVMPGQPVPAPVPPKPPGQQD